MNGKENIIQKILSDADLKCQKILADANAQAQAILQQTEEQIAVERTALEERVKVTLAETLRNSIATAELEARKYKLNQKQKLISLVYQQVATTIANFDANQKLDFVSKLIESYAEDGESVCVCKCDADVITQAFLDGFGKQLKLSNQFANSNGGIVLVGEGYEKDLTITRVVSYLRDKTESQVAQILFGDKK